jgi:uncharacterized protein YndB with AHSA1/START domain
MSGEGTLHTINGEPTLRFERRLRHPPAKVWRAVTDPAELAHWFPAAVQAELRAGAPMRFVFDEEAPVDGEWAGEVLEVDPEKVFMFRWDSDVLRFELIPDADGCLLVFTQSIGGGEIGRLGAGRTAAGWDGCLDRLVGLLDDTSVAEPAGMLTVFEHYIEKFDLGRGTAEAVGGQYRVRFVRDLVWKPVEEVWSLLTDGAPVDTQPPLPATNAYVPAGRVTEVDPPRVLAYEWLHDGAPAGTVRWEIISDDRLGVRVEVTQTLPADLARLRAEMLAAWHVQLELFFAAVFGEVRCPWPEARTAHLARHYADVLS